MPQKNSSISSFILSFFPNTTSQKFTLDWIYNILEHKKEVERIVYEDPDPNYGFLMVPDFKWDGKQIGN